MDKILVEKNGEEQLPIPNIWRPIIKDIVKSFVNRDYKISSGLNNVNFVSDETAEQIREYIDDYGEELVDLPDETWNSSVYIYYGDYWEAIIDLFTKNEGLSDLILNLEIREQNNNYVIDIISVYVS
ncbi:hypothetical protein [Soonwooa sp.]|uniref:DUF7668 domain-containing protein n=1 Tax=Soonwooa sp. TaxID=1938592 RepID=UPI0026278E34|nr:hypothetical protein [Soonwooa sp.]